MSSDVVEAEATSTTEADATAEKPVVAAQPQEADAAKPGKQKPETKAAEKTEAVAKPDASKDAKDAAKPVEAEPVELVFKDKDGNPVTGPVIEAFTSMANEQKWTPEIANKQHERLSQAMGEAKKAMAAAWEKELRADKDFGGAKFDESVGLIKTTLERLGDVGTAAQKFLVETGLEREPRIARLLHAFGKAISPDNKFLAGVAVPGRPGDIPNPDDTSVAAFSSMFKTAAPQQ